jgi:TPR repeat protein
MERSAKLGNIAAQFDLAALYKQGRGVPPDERMAAYWISKAAETGMSNAELEFGIALYLGNGVKKDEAKGFEMIRSSAEKGNPVAQNRLAHAYAGGLGTERDWIAAAKWHLLSREAGVSDFGLDRFLASLTPEERKKAEKSAYDWEQSTSALLQ